MESFFDNAMVRMILLFTGTAVLVAIGVYVVGMVRSRMHDNASEASDLLTNFRDLHAKGELDDEEFRKVKGTLGARLRDELRHDKPNG